MKQTQQGSLLALDVGTKRIGVAFAEQDVRLAHPLATLLNSETVFTDIAKLVAEHHVSTIVVGLPRGLDGQVTAQTHIVESFVDDLKHYVDVSIEWQDEALTSVKAEAELASRHKGGVYNKSDVDALAATYILEDYITEHSRQFL